MPRIKISHVKIIAIFILLTGLIYTFSPTGITVTSSAPSSVLAQNKERVLKHRRFPAEPVQIVHVKNIRKALPLGSKFSEENDWLKGLTISLKNKSDKNIDLIVIELHFIKPDTPEDEPIYAHQLFYNPQSSPQAPIRPKGIGEIRLTDADYEEIMRNLSQENYSLGATEIEVIIDEIQFSDGTLWRSGQFQERTSKRGVAVKKRII